MEKFGYLVPIIVNENMEVGDGAHRVQLYQAMGIEEIPAYIVPKINSDIERRLLRQTMNKLRGEHDIKLDADEMALIFEAGQLNNLAELIAQGRESLENILTKHKGIQFQHEDNFDVDKALEDLVPTTQLGDIWQLGQHRIICADCTDKRSVDRLCEDKAILAILTDPPYMMNKSMENDDLDQTDYESLHEQFMESIPAEDNATLICFHGTARFPIAIDAARKTGWNFERMLWLHKPNDITFPWRGWILISESILVFSKGKGNWRDSHPYHADTYLFNHHGGEQLPENTWHPSVKPQEVLTDLVNRISEQGDIIFDPFLGSGSTLIACEQTNRICYGVEIDPHYCDVVVKRWEAYTNQKAILLKPEAAQ